MPRATLPKTVEHRPDDQEEMFGSDQAASLTCIKALFWRLDKETNRVDVPDVASSASGKPEGMDRAMKASKAVLATAALMGFSSEAQAICPVCTVAVGTGVGLSRWLGVDDTITGLWLGGFTVSLIIWSINWMEQRNIRFRLRTAITVVSYYLLIVLPLYVSGIIGHPNNTVVGIDKLALGMAAGSAAFYVGAWWYERLKKKLGHAAFPFQKVVMPIAPLILLTAVLYFLRGA